MPVEMIGWIAPRISSEIIPVKGPPFDAGVIAETARIHEDADFDSVLVGYFSDAPDGFMRIGSNNLKQKIIEGKQGNGCGWGATTIAIAVFSVPH